MSRDVRIYVEDMVQSVRNVAGWMAGTTFESFVADRKTQAAVERELFVLGEAAKHVPADTRALSPGLPWREMCGLRDVLAHDYFGLDPEILYDVASRRAPSLLPALEALLARLAGG